MDEETTQGIRRSRPVRWVLGIPRRTSRGEFAVICLLVAIFAFDALVQLNELLKGMHISGQPSFGASSLASRSPENVLAVWQAHDTATSAAGHASYQVVLGFHVVIDSLFALVLFGLLLALAGLVRRHDRANKLAKGSACAYLAADLLENGATALLVFADEPCSWLLPLLSYAKWIFFGFALVLIAGQALQRWRGDHSQRPREIRELSHLLRALIVVAPLFGLALIAHPQIPDLIRRWSTLQLFSTLFVTVFLGATVWFISCQLVLQREPLPFLRKPPLIVAIFCGAAAVQLAITGLLRLLDQSFSFGWGLSIPAILTAAGATLGWLLHGGTSEVRRRRLGAWTRGLPALLGASVLVGLGLGALRASLSEGVFTRRLWDFHGVIPGHGEQLHPLVLVGFSIVMPFGAWFMFRWLYALSPDLGPRSDDSQAEEEPISTPTTADDALADESERRAAEAATSRARTRAQLSGVWWIVVGLAALFEVIVFALVLSDVQWLAETFGGVAVLAAFIAAVAMLAGLIVWLSDSIAYPDVLPGRTAPIILLLVAWYVIAAKIDSHGPHDIRVVASARVADAPTLSEAWGCWLVKNGLDPGQRKCPFEPEQFTYRTERSGGAVPLVVVATSGGATRAAYWTATVLDCVFEVLGDDTPCSADAKRVAPGNFRRSNAIFALSGISGGSVGFATYASHLAERADKGSKGSWIDSRLDRDFLSPTVSWSLYVELPQSLLRYRHEADNAEMLERSWEAAWSEGGARGDWGLFELWRDRHVVPLLLLNGTSVEDGCRFNGSVLDASVETIVRRAGEDPKVRFHDCRATGPFDETETSKEGSPTSDTSQEILPKSALAATRDLADFLCGRTGRKLDVPLSTAAILSARFPYVSSSGRVERRCGDDDQGNKVTYVVDGGYLETSGASPLVELHDKLEPMIRSHNRRPGNEACVVPFMIQIDNGYEDDAAAQAAERPIEVVVPPATILAVRGARAAGAKTQSALLFDRAYDGVKLDGDPLTDRYAHFVIQTHAGAKAPLGWALSETAREALRKQLTQPKNAAALREVRRWLRPDNLGCGNG